jgi:hypothetical protein
MLGDQPSNQVEIRLDHDMPFFDHFEMSVNGEGAVRMSGSTETLALPAGKTSITARCVDTFGRPGHEAKLTIDLDPADAELIAMRGRQYWLD